jgi:hypothetical protein
MSNIDRSASATTRKHRDRAILSFHKMNPDANLGGGSILSSGVLTELRKARIIFTGTQISNFAVNSFILDNTSPYYPTYNLRYALTWDTLPLDSAVKITSNISTDLIVYSGIVSANVYRLTNGDTTTKRIFTLIASTNNSIADATVSL